MCIQSLQFLVPIPIPSVPSRLGPFGTFSVQAPFFPKILVRVDQGLVGYEADHTTVDGDYLRSATDHPTGRPTGHYCCHWDSAMMRIVAHLAVTSSQSNELSFELVKFESSSKLKTKILNTQTWFNIPICHACRVLSSADCKVCMWLWSSEVNWWSQWLSGRRWQSCAIMTVVYRNESLFSINTPTFRTSFVHVLPIGLNSRIGQWR